LRGRGATAEEREGGEGRNPGSRRTSPHSVVLLLDEIFIQLGGFAFGTSKNKTYREADAIELFRYACTWLESSDRSG
jgi:hypothetical protein